MNPSFIPNAIPEPALPSFHFNPTVNQSSSSNTYTPTTGSDFLHHANSQILTSEATTRTSISTPPPPPAPVVKGPIPTEHQIIQDTFDLFINRCQQATQQLPLKRKLDEVKKKLDVLYDKLRENKVCVVIL